MSIPTIIRPLHDASFQPYKMFGSVHCTCSNTMLNGLNISKDNEFKNDLLSSCIIEYEHLP